MIETHSRRAAADELARKSGTRWRPFDEYGVKHPGQSFLRRRSHRDFCRLAPLRIEGAEIDQKTLRAGNEGADFLRRQRHRRDQPAASSTLAVKFCATALVMQ